MMNNGAVLFLGILLSLAGSFWALLLAPQLQIGRAQLRQLESGELYPSARPGLAQRGAEVYRSLGCAECHTRQVRQTGAHFEMRLTDLGTNPPAVVTVYSENSEGTGTGEEGLDGKNLRKLPALVGTNLPPGTAQKMMGQYAAVGAKAAPILIPLGSDIERGWGARLSVAQDYLHDYPVQLGNIRLGPDLANYGERQTNATAVIEHLRNPQKAVPGSIMPSYGFVSNEDIQSLAAYLLSLKADALLFESPRAKPAAPAAPATNAPAAPVK